MELLPLSTKAFGRAEHAFTRHNATVPPQVTREEMEKPYFWSHVQKLLTTFDEIRAVAEDGSFVATLLVQYADAQGVYVKVVSWTDLNAAKVEETAVTQGRYQVKQKGRLKWCLVDTETGANIREGIPRQSDAIRELEEHLRALAS